MLWVWSGLEWSVRRCDVELRPGLTQILLALRRGIPKVRPLQIWKEKIPSKEKIKRLHVLLWLQVSGGSGVAAVILQGQLRERILIHLVPGKQELPLALEIEGQGTGSGKVPTTL